MNEPNAENKSMTGFAEGLMKMSQRGALKNMRLTRQRAEACLKTLADVIYYFPDCRCAAKENDSDDCHCHDNYFAGIAWLKNTIFRTYPDLSDSNHPYHALLAGNDPKKIDAIYLRALFPLTDLTKQEAIYLRDALKIADDLFGDQPDADAAFDWAHNLIHKRYSIFDLAG